MKFCLCYLSHVYWYPYPLVIKNNFKIGCYVVHTILGPLLVRSSLGPEIRKFTVSEESMPLEKFYE